MGQGRVQQLRGYGADGDAAVVGQDGGEQRAVRSRWPEPQEPETAGSAFSIAASPVPVDPRVACWRPEVARPARWSNPCRRPAEPHLRGLAEACTRGRGTCMRQLPCLTVAPGGGGEAEGRGAGGVAVESEVKPISNAGDVAPRAKTWTRVGMWVFPSMAIRTEPTSERGSRGVRSSWYAGRPATDGRRVGGDLGARVDRRNAASRRPAAGSSPRPRATGAAAGVLAASLVGTTSGWRCCRELDQAQRSAPLCTRSDSPSWPSRASRMPVGPGVPDPQRVGAGDQRGEARRLPPPPPRSAGTGSPRSEVSTTVPERAWSFACCTSASSWAAVRGGRGLGRWR